MFQDLKVNDVNSVHLVCRNLHQIANLLVNPVVRFKEGSSKPLEDLVQSSRIFEELKFYMRCTDLFASQEKFEVLEEYLGFTGFHVKELTLSRMKVDPLILQKFLSLLPNLKSLELFNVESTGLEEVPIKSDLKPSKIEKIRMFGCTGLEGLLGCFENCAIQEVKLKDWPSVKSEVLVKFLEVQKGSLKKLVGRSCDFGFLANVKDLHLEHLEYSNRRSFIGFLKFLKQQVDLKFLSLFLSDEYSYETCNTICELKNLETLVLDGISNSGLNQLHKLEKLKKLRVGFLVSRNILDHLKFGVFNDLEELDAHFFNVSWESVGELKRIVPNLKKLVIHAAFSNTINAILETLDSLESVKIQNAWVMSRKVCPSIKHLRVALYKFEFNAELLTKKFPNLEDLKINDCSLEVKESFFAMLLSGLKQLKTLCLRIWSRSKLDPESALRWMQVHGKHLEEVNIIFYFPDPKIDPMYAIEKKPGGAFCIKNESINASWIFG